MISGLDKKKINLFFNQLNQSQLINNIPLGNLNKLAVREIAKNNLVTADKKDSQGLCFIGKLSFLYFYNKTEEKSEKLF